METHNIIKELNINERGFIPKKEDEQLEYKTKFLVRHIPQYVKIIVGMANTEGGCLLFGARETNNQAIIIGLDKTSLLNFKNFQESFQSIINNDYIGTINVTFGITDINNKPIAAVFIEKSSKMVISIKDGRILIREKDRTIHKRLALDETDAKELALRRLVSFTDINNFSGYTSLKNYRIQSKLSRKQYIYKYMSLETFIQCIENGTLMFQEPIGWDDQYEMRFYRADYTKMAPHAPSVSDTPKMYATCTTKKKDNEAAWKVYAHGKTGLDSRCVQLKIDLKQFRSYLNNSALNAKNKVNKNSIKCTIYEGIVFYGLSENEILELHDTKSPWYNVFFKSFNINSFIALHLLKRPAYAYEEEIRFFMVPDTPSPRNLYAKKAERLFVEIPLNKLIKEIRLDKRCSESEILAARSICLDKGIELTDKSFKPRSIPTSPTIKIPVEIFDIDRMPGTKKITIK